MIKDYIYLCKLFGGCYDLVQTNGGNISVKSNTQIIIKRSGFKMIETELNKGYVICDINKIKSQIENNNEDLKNTIIEGEGIGTTPSIETFFHCLPKKYIVHLHPIYLLYFLCQTNWRSIIDSFNFSFKYISIEYHKPGIELSNSIFKSYKNEDVLFLQNHGVILCSDTIEDIINFINIVNNKIKTTLTNTHITDIIFLNKLYNILPNKIIKSCAIKNINNDRYFYKLSPDLFLYLGEYPIIIESSETDIKYEIDKCINTPNVIIHNNLVYCISNNYEGVRNLEEMVETYYQIISINPQIHFNEINNSKVLLEWDKEKLRLNILP